MISLVASSWAKKKDRGLLERLLGSTANQSKVSHPSASLHKCFLSSIIQILPPLSEKPTEKIDLYPDDCVIL